jgi:Na+-transporting methylmalonyl-CoA/oxaloacetate decarboxylase gamma subunit
MLSVLGVLAFLWALLIIAVCAVCAIGGAVDEQSEEWYREQKRRAEDVDQQGRGAA